jgi:hypothetical protein
MVTADGWHQQKSAYNDWQKMFHYAIGLTLPESTWAVCGF